MSVETKTVHFRIAERFGILLVEIAQEHLTERNNPVQALKAITDSLHGCPTELAVPILKGDIVLLVDEENQQVITAKRIPKVHDKLGFPKLDPLYWMEKRKDDVVTHGENLITAFKELQSQIRTNRNLISLALSYDDVFKFISGKSEDVLEQLRENAEIDFVASLFDTTKEYIELTMSIKTTMEWMLNTFDEFSDSNIYPKFRGYKEECSEMLTDVMMVMKETLNFEFRMDDLAEFDNVSKYIDSVRKIDEVIKKGIEPVNIMDNYSAGWLSPEGEYYALHGEIANMLHIQIADALMEKGTIPELDEKDFKVIGECWLEQNGWVKIHSDNINYGGCLNSKLLQGGKPMKNVDMTDKQKEIIYKYIQKLHNGVMRLGWKQEKISAARFETLDNAMMNKNYFEF